jgi:Secretion system C-terminal sorting domain/FG-GAP-like repeat
MKYFYTVLFSCFAQITFAQFAPPVIIDSTNIAYANHIVVADMNSDNQNDILFGYLDDSICWYQNNNLNFRKKPSIYITGINTIKHFDAADIDGDGIKEVVVSVKGNVALVNRVLLYKFNGTAWVSTVLDNNIVLNVAKSYFVDMDNDGDLDIMSCHDVDIVKYINTGGVYSARNVLISTSEYYNMVVKDFDGNGFKDFMVNTANGTQLHLANSTNTAYIQSTIAPDIRNMLEPDDIDNDGDIDFIFSNDADANLIDTYKNNGSGVFSFFQNVTAYIPDHPTVPFKTIKINADNYTDMVYRSPVETGIRYKINDGTGGFPISNMVDALYNYVFVSAADLNNDQKGDIIWVGARNNKKYIGYTKNISTTVGTNAKNHSKNEIQIFPNPTKNTLTIKHDSTNPTNNTIVTNSLGQIIFQNHTTIPSEIEVSNWATGIYFLNINGQTYKFLKN